MLRFTCAAAEPSPIASTLALVAALTFSVPPVAPSTSTLRLLAPMKPTPTVRLPALTEPAPTRMVSELKAAAASKFTASTPPCP